MWGVFSLHEEAECSSWLALRIVRSYPGTDNKIRCCHLQETLRSPSFIHISLSQPVFSFHLSSQDELVIDDERIAASSGATHFFTQTPRPVNDKTYTWRIVVTMLFHSDRYSDYFMPIGLPILYLWRHMLLQRQAGPDMLLWHDIFPHWASVTMSLYKGDFPKVWPSSTF